MIYTIEQGGNNVLMTSEFDNFRQTALQTHITESLTFNVYRLQGELKLAASMFYDFSNSEWNILDEQHNPENAKVFATFEEGLEELGKY